MALIKCPNCNESISDKSKFCSNCGAPLIKLNEPDTALSKDIPLNRHNNNKKTGKKNNVKNGCLVNIICLFSFLIFPPLGIFLTYKFKNYPRSKFGKIFVWVIYGFYTFAWFISALSSTEDVNKENSHNNSSAIVQEDNNINDNDNANESESDYSVSTEIIETEDIYKNIELPEKYKEKFYNACLSCGIDPQKTKNYEQKNDWANGERYTFDYENNTLISYFLGNGEVSSIGFNNNSIKFYEYGYEPLNYQDFCIDIGTISTLQLGAEKVVETSVNYPRTLDFDWWTTGSYYRAYDYYILNVEFSCENAFGVEEEHILRLDARYSGKEGDTPELVYVQIDNQVMMGKIETPEIIKIPIEIESTNNDAPGITLQYGVAGQYGKEEDFDGETFIRYYLPVGKYLASSQTGGGGFFIESIETHKEDGYKTSTVYERITFSSFDDVKTIEIKDGQCISLIIHSIVEFNKL